MTARTSVSAVLAGATLLLASCSAPEQHVTRYVGVSPPASASASASASTAELDVAAENAKPGTTAWKIASTSVGSVDEVGGYADHGSVVAGQSFGLFVSTSGTSLTAAAYRMGYYGGTGGRQVWRSGPLPARRQSAQSYVAATRTVIARWTRTATVPTTGWVPGVYLVKLTAVTGGGTKSRFVPVVVRSRSTAGRTVLMQSTQTWQAYNTFGGRSAYTGPQGFASRAYAVSFDRPNTWGAGAGKFVSYERPVVELAEKLGLPLAYESDVDLGTVGGVLDGARAVVVMGHGEYWTVPQRNVVEAARDAGTNLLFLGANTSYWRVRLSSGSRLMTIYKSASLDPADPAADTTTLWRAAPKARPERLLTGLAYNCYPAKGTFTVVSPSFWGFAGTGVKRGSTFAGIVGIEVDHAVNATGTPRPLEVVASSPTTCGNTSTRSSMSYYTNRAGAGVVSTGSMGWVVNGMSASKVPAASFRFVAAVTARLLTEASRGGLGRLHPATDNLKTYGSSG